MPEEGPTPPDRPARRSRSRRWPGLFQRCREAVFLLDRRRKLLFVNRAWERLTGFPFRDVRGLVCQRRLPKATPKALHELARALRPPPEVLRGKTLRARRWLGHPQTGAYCCDVQFVPLAGAESPLAILGKLLPVRLPAPPGATPLSPQLLTLRERFAHHFTLEMFRGRVPAVVRVREQVRLAVPHAFPVLIQGEPGTGKHWLARLLHFQGPAREQVMVALDCRRLPARALAAALFDEAGLPRRKERGTLYLKAPSYLPRELQSRLWEAFLSEVPAEGSALAGPAAVLGPRVLAGCVADPQAEIQAGRFLEPLACALSTLTVVLPPLRQRLDDLPWLVDHALDRARQNTSHRSRELSEEAWHFLRLHSWPGNLRELYTVLCSACARARGERIEAGDLPWYVRASADVERPGDRMLELDTILGEVDARLDKWRKEVRGRMGLWRDEVERNLLVQALLRSQGDKTRAADLLSISRPRLLRRMKELGVSGSERRRRRGQEIDEGGQTGHLPETGEST
jgi:DNA-binding NtrC family response regulator